MRTLVRLTVLAIGLIVVFAILNTMIAAMAEDRRYDEQEFKRFKDAFGFRPRAKASKLSPDEREQYQIQIDRRLFLLGKRYSEAAERWQKIYPGPEAKAAEASKNKAFRAFLDASSAAERLGFVIKHNPLDYMNRVHKPQAKPVARFGLPAVVYLHEYE